MTIELQKTLDIDEVEAGNNIETEEMAALLVIQKWLNDGADDETYMETANATFDAISKKLGSEVTASPQNIIDLLNKKYDNSNTKETPISVVDKKSFLIKAKGQLTQNEEKTLKNLNGILKGVDNDSLVINALIEKRFKDGFVDDDAKFTWKGVIILNRKVKSLNLKRSDLSKMQSLLKSDKLEMVAENVTTIGKLNFPVSVGLNNISNKYFDNKIKVLNWHVKIKDLLALHKNSKPDFINVIYKLAVLKEGINYSPNKKRNITDKNLDIRMDDICKELGISPSYSTKNLFTMATWDWPGSGTAWVFGVPNYATETFKYNNKTPSVNSSNITWSFMLDAYGMDYHKNAFKKGEEPRIELNIGNSILNMVIIKTDKGKTQLQFCDSNYSDGSRIYHDGTDWKNVKKNMGGEIFSTDKNGDLVIKSGNNKITTVSPDFMFNWLDDKISTLNMYAGLYADGKSFEEVQCAIIAPGGVEQTNPEYLKLVANDLFLSGRAEIKAPSLRLAQKQKIKKAYDSGNTEFEISAWVDGDAYTKLMPELYNKDDSNCDYGKLKTYFDGKTININIKDEPISYSEFFDKIKEVAIENNFSENNAILVAVRYLTFVQLIHETTGWKAIFNTKNLVDNIKKGTTTSSKNAKGARAERQVNFKEIEVEKQN